MPITSSAKKALKQNQKARVANAKRKRVLHDVAKDMQDLIKAGKKDEATKLLPKLMKAADKTSKRNIIAKNKAARIKSRMSKLLK